MTSDIELSSEQKSFRTLQDDLQRIQKKTFTNYINSILVQADMKVEDLFVDLASGVALLKLLELVSGRQLPPPCRGNMRFHHVDNVSKCLEFLHSIKMHVESIGAEDIVDGNPRLTLGLVWTIILRFHIQDVNGKNKTETSSKEALLLWCQRQTSSYEDVTISNFTDSWSNGLAFNALIHSQDRDLFDFSGLLGRSNLDNLRHAFKIAKEHFNIPPLLDAEDVDTKMPDEKSIMAYVASYYYTFAINQEQPTIKQQLEKLLREKLCKEQLEREEALYQDELKNHEERLQRRKKFIILCFCIFMLFISHYIIKHGYTFALPALAVTRPWGV